jgi:hypothetical protein
MDAVCPAVSGERPNGSRSEADAGACSDGSRNRLPGEGRHHCWGSD